MLELTNVGPRAQTNQQNKQEQFVDKEATNEYQRECLQQHENTAHGGYGGHVGVPTEGRGENGEDVTVWLMSSVS